jgi:hypothetical protein
MYTDIVFPECGVHFVAVNDGVDSTRGENEFAAIRNIFNEMFARDTSKKIRATWQNKGKSGEYLCTNPPYGYDKNPGDKKKWVVDEAAAAVVQKIFSLCMEGFGPTQIAKHLRNEKILCPAAHKLSNGIKSPNTIPKDPCKWSSEIVSSILRRMEYLGHTVNFKTHKTSYKNKEKIFNDPEKWAVFENTHEPIIEESVFVIVQKLRQSRRRPTKMGDMGMFSGIIFCEDCGAKMYLCRGTHFKSEQEYYVCSNYRKDRELCTTHTIRNIALEEIVLQNLREAISYVSRHEKDFIREASETTTQERDREFANLLGLEVEDLDYVQTFLPQLHGYQQKVISIKYFNYRALNQGEIKKSIHNAGLIDIERRAIENLKRLIHGKQTIEHEERFNLLAKNLGIEAAEDLPNLLKKFMPKLTKKQQLIMNARYFDPTLPSQGQLAAQLKMRQTAIHEREHRAIKSLINLFETHGIY